jgi:hypothetical protein
LACPRILFYLFLLAVGVETSDKRDIRGLLYRIFAALKFDGAKFEESPTLTMQECLFLDREAKEQATSKSRKATFQWMIKRIRVQEVDESGIRGADAVREEQDSRPGAS